MQRDFEIFSNPADPTENKILKNVAKTRTLKRSIATCVKVRGNRMFLCMWMFFVFLAIIFIFDFNFYMYLLLEELCFKNAK